MITEYPPDWDSRRRAVYRRDGYTCQNCGREGGPNGNAELHAHHVVPKSKGGVHDLENLQTVCDECHRAIHSSALAPTAHTQFATSNQTDSNRWVTRIVRWIVRVCVQCAIRFLAWVLGFGRTVVRFGRREYRWLNDGPEDPDDRYGTIRGHVVVALLTYWWTLGLGNLSYAAYKRATYRAASHADGDAMDEREVLGADGD